MLFLLIILILYCKLVLKVTKVTSGVSNLIKFENTTIKINQFLSEGLLFFLINNSLK